MKKIVTLLVILLFSGSNAAAQAVAPPDYNTIYSNVANKDSEFYYSKLLDRYKAADTSMTLDERRHLYYGSVIMKKSTSYEQSRKALELMNTILVKETPSPEDLVTVLACTETILERIPFSLTIKQYRQFCLKQLGRYNEAKNERAQAEMVADAILSSGDGSSIEKSIHVVDAENEFEIVTLLGYEIQGNEYATNGRTDYIILSKNTYDTPGLYFEVAQPPREITGL